MSLDKEIMDRPPKVSVCVVTYNQEKYIRQCLQSIVDQETDFDFEVIVADDCSTDRTSCIVQEFADKYPIKTFLSRTLIFASGMFLYCRTLRAMLTCLFTAGRRFFSEKGLIR